MATTAKKSKATAATAKAAKKEPMVILGYSLIELRNLVAIVTVVHLVLAHSGMGDIVHSLTSALIL